MDKVSIQPKPKKGLVDDVILFLLAWNKKGFNPAEAEEGFSSWFVRSLNKLYHNCFNPAEAEEGFSSGTIAGLITIGTQVSIQPKPKKGLVVIVPLGLRVASETFQSSRSRRRV